MKNVKGLDSINMNMMSIVNCYTFQWHFHLINCAYGKKMHLEYTLEKFRNPNRLKKILL